MAVDKCHSGDTEEFVMNINSVQQALAILKNNEVSDIFKSSEMMLPILTVGDLLTK